MSVVLAKTEVSISASERRFMREGLFMISCAARTGSSMLVNMLQSHPDITCHMEIFAPARVEGFSGAYRERLATEVGFEEKMRVLRSKQPSAYIYKFALDPQGRLCAGFKFKHEEFIMPCFAGARTSIVSDTDIKIIMLRRRNLLRRHLSHVRAVTNGVTMRRQGDPPVSAPPVYLNPTDCIADFRETHRLDRFVTEMLGNHDVHEIFYEDLVGTDNPRVISNLLDFLGVEPKPLRTVHERLSTDNLQDQIVNFVEIQQAFAGGPYESFLEANS